ncbi:MAG TPA: hypothetical protein VLR47_10270, partial [Rhodospirillales bacterium]|nr:hypothetical protein [Rhodospirillales bacterium]
MAASCRRRAAARRRSRLCAGARGGSGRGAECPSCGSAGGGACGRNELLATIRGLIEARRGAEAEKQRSLSDRLIAAAEKTAASGQAMLDGIVDEVGGAPGVTEWFARRARDPEA